MNMILTDMSLLSVFIMPIIPVELTIQANGSNEIIETLDGEFNIIKYQKLKSLSWSSFFPVNKSYGFIPRGAYSNGWLYIAFLDLMKKYRLPIRVILTTKNKIPVFNSLMSIDEFSYSIDKVGDINYSIKLSEFYEKFVDFLDREKKVLKYITKDNIKKQSRILLEKYGLVKNDL